MKILKKIVKNRYWRWVLPPLALFSAWIFWMTEVEPLRVVRHVVTVTVPKLPAAQDGMKIAVVSDFHFRRYMVDRGIMDKIVQIVESEKVDLIVLPGDFANNFSNMISTLPNAEITAQLQRLHAPGGVYAVPGNHDKYALSHNYLRETLAAAGVILLENANTRIAIRGEILQLAGVSDYKTGNARIDLALRGMDTRLPILLLSHNPELFSDPENRADLMISGHTHGGQVYLGKLVNACVLFNFDLRWIRGLYREDDRQLAVTSGVGTSSLRIRFNVPPEVMIITLKKN